MKVSPRDAVRVFKALSDVTRVEIVQLLGTAPRNVTELTSLVGVSQPKVSRHLKILRDAGLLRDVRKGKWVWYELALPEKDEPLGPTIFAISSILAAHGIHGATNTVTRQPSERSARGTAGAADTARRAVRQAARGVSQGLAEEAKNEDAENKKSRVPRKKPAQRVQRVLPVRPIQPVHKQSPRKNDIEDFLL